MNLFKNMRVICFQNIRKWSTNYRVWVIGLCTIMLLHLFMNGIGIFSQQLGIKVSPWIFPFLYGDRYIKMLFVFPIILLFCDAPFVDENQVYVLLRSKRFSWNLGQVAYIFIASAIYFIFIIICTMIINLPHMTFTMEWGKIYNTLASTNALDSVDTYMKFDSTIVRYFTPMQGMGFTFLLSWLCGVFLGLLIYVVNLISKTRTIGIFLAAFFVILSGVVSGNAELQWFSPVSWISVNTIDIGGMTKYPTFTYIMAMYLTLITVLTILSVILTRKNEVVVLPRI